MAGTRPRGSTSLEDKELLNDLILSEKDRSENTITGEFIEKAFIRLHDMGLIEEEKDPMRFGGNFFVRRLQHLQHICQSFQGEMKSEEFSVGKTKLSYHFFAQIPCYNSINFLSKTNIRCYQIFAK